VQALLFIKSKSRGVLSEANEVSRIEGPFGRSFGKLRTGLRTGYNNYVLRIYLLCLNKSFYIGHTNNLKKRYKEHCDGLVKYTKSLRPLKLVYYETYNTKSEAIRREKQLKGWSRQKKINLIRHKHPTKNNK